MDPLTLASAAFSVVAPYLAKLSGRVVEGIGDDVSATAMTAARNIWSRIRSSLGGDAAQETADAFELDPGNEDRIEMLKALVAARIRADAQFAAELEELMSRAERAGWTQSFQDASDVGIIAQKVDQRAGRDIVNRDQINFNRPPDMA